MTKHVLILSTFTAASLFAQASTGWTHTQVRTGPPASTLDGQSGIVLNRPFTGTEAHGSTQILADGTHLDHNDTGKVARDEKGRLRIDSGTTTVIYDPVGGFTYTLHAASKTYQKSPLPAGADSYAVALAGNRTSVTWNRFSVTPGKTVGTTATTRPAAQTTTEELPRQILNGLNVRGSRVTTTVPAGAMGNDREFKIVNERWYSDDLQVLVKSTNTDPRFGVSTYELSSVTQSAANAALFAVPADYTLMPMAPSTYQHPHEMMPHE